MFFRLLILSCVVLAVVSTSILPTRRPKDCVPGRRYKKDCNICTCGNSPQNDACSRINCERQNTTKRPTNGVRPGICPTVATAPPGNSDCSRRTVTSQCTVDKECSGAKKCCKNGCGITLCRNAIYNYI